MADNSVKYLVDLPLSEVQQIAKDLGVRGYDMPDRVYLSKAIAAKRRANAIADANGKASAAIEEANEKAAEAAEASPKADDEKESKSKSKSK